VAKKPLPPCISSHGRVVGQADGCGGGKGSSTLRFEQGRGYACGEGEVAAWRSRRASLRKNLGSFEEEDGSVCRDVLVIRGNEHPEKSDIQMSKSHQ
jgi:hypothetical protein